VLGEFMGVEARSNGTRRRWTWTGWGEWQCVEYVKRFYAEAMGTSINVSIGPARNFYYSFDAKNLAQFDLALHANSAGGLPKATDILVFDGGSYGHVGVIAEVMQHGSDTATIRIIEQNWNDTTCFSELTAVKKDGKFEIGNHGNYTTLGWLSSTKDAVPSDGSNNAEPPFTFSSHAYTGYGPELGGEDTGWHFSLPRTAGEFTSISPEINFL
jgi:surface antigen